MASHRKRIREYVESEAELLRAASRKTRTLDHKGNRGTDSERSLQMWLGTRFAPDYAVSGGEIIDSFDTNAHEDACQQDCVLHQSGANRFIFPSGMRLLPIESVVAVVEVKRRLTRKWFLEADKKAERTSRLRLAISSGSTPLMAVGKIPGPSVTHSPISENDRENGIACNDARLRPNRVTFAVFGLQGPKTPEVLAKWLREATTVSVVCCIGGGCVSRSASPAGFPPTHSSGVSQADDALPMFVHYLDCAVDQFEGLRRFLHVDLVGYSGFRRSPLTFWDETGSYEHPSWYRPTPEELLAREELYQRRPKLRPK